MKTLLSIGECMVEMADTGQGHFAMGFAGDSFNTAWHARRALPGDWTVGYFSAVGEDPTSGRMLDFMARAGVDTAHVARLPGKRPGLYLIELANGERSFAYWRDGSAARHLADDPARLEAVLGGANAIFFSGITLAILSEQARSTLLAALARARARGAVVAFDSNLRPALWPDAGTLREAIRAAARVTTIALPTIPDESDLFNEKSQLEVATRYRAAGVTEVAVRAGPGAALLSWGEQTAMIAPARTVVPVDTTGAGDSFNGAYLAARLAGAEPPDACRAAHATAARVIGRPGALR
jgi:2-dehydro-3-deoxygluconokinase